jgi:hypothetical protein
MVLLADLAIDASLQFDVGKLTLIDVWNEPWPDRAGAVEVLTLSHVELGMPHPIADRAVIAQRERRDVLECFSLWNPTAPLPMTTTISPS